MKTARKNYLFYLFLLLCLTGVLFGQAKGEKIYYGIEIKGTLCGYLEMKVSAQARDGQDMMVLEEKLILKLAALGQDVDTEIRQTYHIDPETGDFFYYDGDISQGGVKIGSTVMIDGEVARFTSKVTGKSKRLKLSPDVVRPNRLFAPFLIRDFADSEIKEKSYKVFDVRKGEIQEVTYTREGKGKLELAGKEYRALALKEVNRRTGTSQTYWLDSENGRFLKGLLPNSTFYLTEPAVVNMIKMAALDDVLFARVDVVIKNILSISYMKAKASIVSTGEWITPQSLNVPGQRFSGTVKENHVEGIFEIQHQKYDGKDAPPFPPDFGRDETLKKYLEPEDLIEADDPVLVKKAGEITAGAEDSWAAACRLSKWVAEEIGYDIPGGISARKTYDQKLGECSAHSRLLTALCRAVGIPARLVIGCTYTPTFGGSFGQHAWNEIYMGRAGWIPVDSTAHEIDYVDSGHIRLGHETSFNPKKMEILDYKAAEPEKSGAEDDIPETYKPYIGKYTANFGPFRNTIFTVMVQNGSLAVDIPGQMIFELNEPNEEGLWIFKFTRLINVSFQQDSSGKVTHMTISQATPLPRKAEDEADAAVDETVPQTYRPYLGTYTVPMQNTELTVLFKDNNLAVNDPNEGIIRLKGPDKTGKWIDQFDKNKISFDTDDAGKVTAMVFHQRFSIPRGTAAALIVAETIESSGIEEALKKYRELKQNPSDAYFFSQRSFNNLGYQLLGKGKTAEAVEILKLNVEAYPKSWNAYDSLAEAYMKNGDNQLAVKYYRKSLELNPKNENGKKMLKKLEQAP